MRTEHEIDNNGLLTGFPKKHADGERETNMQQIVASGRTAKRLAAGVFNPGLLVLCSEGTHGR